MKCNIRKDLDEEKLLPRVTHILAGKMRDKCKNLSGSAKFSHISHVVHFRSILALFRFNKKGQLGGNGGVMDQMLQ